MRTETRYHRINIKAETQIWLEFAFRCRYIGEQVFHELDERYEHIYAMLTMMERMADSFCKN